MRGRIKTWMLSPKTLYGAYLLFKISLRSLHGFKYQTAEVPIRIVDEGDPQTRTVYLDPSRFWRLGRRRPRQPSPAPDPLRGILYPKSREDEWWEIELGEFFNKRGDDKELEMAVYEIKNDHNWKGVLKFKGSK